MQVFPVDVATFLRIAFLCNTSGGWFWQSYHGTVKSPGCLFFDFPPLRAFTFDQKLSRNVVQIILYYHVTKQFLSYLNWLVTCFQFQNTFWKNINCFRFWWKIYANRCISNYVISRFKSLPSPVLWVSSGASSFRVWFGKRKNAA